VTLLDDLKARARARDQRIVLAESSDPRVVQAAGALATQGLVRPVLVRQKGLGAIPAGVEVVDPSTDPRREAFAARVG